MTQIVFMCLAFATVVFSPVLVLVAQGQPQVGGVALVIPGPGGIDMGQMNLSEIGPVRAPVGFFVEIETDDNIAALYESGALLVIDGKKVLQLCMS